MWTTVALCLISQVPPSPSYPELVRQAHADLGNPKSVAPHLRYRYRYLARPRQWTEKEWALAIPAIVGHLNQLSRSALHYPPGSPEARLVGPGLLRVNVHELGYLSVWDRLQDVYFTDTGYIDREWGYWADAAKTKWVKTKVVREPIANAPAQILMDGPEDAAMLDELTAWTRSKAAMVRADWFCNATLASENRDPGYPEFMGFTDEKSFHRMVGFDQKVSKAFRFEVRDAVSRSGVTLQPRAIVRWDSTGAGIWLTRDFLLPKDGTDPLEVIGEDIERAFDASEQYGTLPNNLFAFGAFDRKGVLQRRVPENIATNHVSRSNDKGIHPGVSCIVCHGKGGLRDLKAWHREIIDTPLRADFRARYGEDAEAKEKELRQMYQADLAALLDGDRARYEAAIRKATGGLTSEAFAKGIDDLWQRYENADVNAAYVAAEFGMTAAEFRRKLKVVQDNAAATGYPEIPPTIGALRHEGKREQSIPIRSWERVAGKTYLLIRGVK